MTAANWQACCDITLDYEGGNDDDPHDPGGRTSRGITQREYNRWRASHPGLPVDVWRAPQATIVDIYRQEYWNPVAGDTWARGCDLVVYDAGVNSGLGKALAWSRYTLNASTGNLAQLAILGQHADSVAFIKRFQARRLSFLEHLGTWGYFGRGWGRRVAGIEALALKMAGGTFAVAAEATKARKKKTAAGGASTGSLGASGAAATQVHVHSLTDMAIGAALALAAVAVVLYLVHIYRTQSIRTAALQEALK